MNLGDDKMMYFLLIWSLRFISIFSDVVFPLDGKLKLPKMPDEPLYDAEKGERKYKTTKRMIEARGVEEVQQ